MIERLNNSTNLLSALLIIVGALLCLVNVQAGTSMISGGFGIFGGAQLAKNSNPNA